VRSAKETDRALRRAGRLLARVEAMRSDIARVLCSPAVRRAQRQVELAGRLIDEGIAVVQRLALQQLDFDKGPEMLLSWSFIDRRSWRALRDLQYSYLVGSRSLRGAVELPSRSDLRRELALNPRRAYRRYTRVAQLPGDSPLLLAMRATLKPRAEAKRRPGGRGGR
jgi:hypothetical protein